MSDNNAELIKASMPFIGRLHKQYYPGYNRRLCCECLDRTFEIRTADFKNYFLANVSLQAPTCRGSAEHKSHRQSYFDVIDNDYGKSSAVQCKSA